MDGPRAPLVAVAEEGRPVAPLAAVVVAGGRLGLVG